MHEIVYGAPAKETWCGGRLEMTHSGQIWLPRVDSPALNRELDLE